MKLSWRILLGLAITILSCNAYADPIPNFNLPTKTFFKTAKKFNSDRKVFAWFMMCCGAFDGGNSGTVDQQTQAYKREILMAKSMGIDGFGLDYMESNDVYHKSAEAMFEAAKEVGPDFKLFFEFDNGVPSKDPGDYVALIQKYHDHPNYFRVDGRPLVGDYAADSGFPDPAQAVKWWSDTIIDPLHASGIDVYFVPTTFGQFGQPQYAWISKEATEREVPGWKDVAQGQSVWMIQLSPIGGGIGVLENYADALHAAHKSWMSTISTHYWVGSSRSVPGWAWNQPSGSYFEHAGGQGLEAQWKSVIETQKPEWVMLLTWNDYNESYMEPIDDYKKYTNSIMADTPLGWYKPQAGMDELNRYFIQWYKTGTRPTITADSLFYAYRTSSAHLQATGDTRTPITGGNGPIADSVYVTTALTAPAELRVSSGGIVTSHNVPAGIQHTVVPFQSGDQIFSLWRNGVQINSITGEPVVASIKYYDYWPTTGYVETPVLNPVSGKKIAMQ